MTPASLTAVARHLSFIRETEGPNRGAWVSKLQRDCHGIDGDPWCADFVSFVLDVAYHGGAPLSPTGSTRAMLAQARAKGFSFSGDSAALKDDLYFFLRDDGTPHHVGIVTVGNASGLQLAGIAGNTSEDGLSAEGTGVFEHALTVAPNRIVFVRLPK